jgi:glycine/D-amino acid oxidase-like deaminating enzyme
MSAHSTIFERNQPSPAAVAAALSKTQQRVYWTEDVPSPAAPTLRGSMRADVTVVGGGYCGLWTALFAKRRNPAAKIVIVEANQVGWAASGRNGGFVDASLTHGDENGRSRWPAEYSLLQSLGRENLDQLEDDILALDLDVEFERTGMLSVAYEPHQVQWLRDVNVGKWLDRDDVQAEIASPIFEAGRWVTDECALVHPAKLVQGLAQVARELGIEIFENSRVKKLSSGRTGDVVVRTEHGSVTSSRVALATNVFKPLLKRARRATVPVYDYVLMTEPLSDEQMRSIGWQNRQGLGDLANQFHYSRLTADNRILYGGYDAIYHAGGRLKTKYEDRPATFSRLASHFLTTFPQLEGVHFTHKWAGAIDTSTQFCAFHGQARGGRVAYAAGFTGLGVGATRFAAQVMVDHLSGKRTPRTELEMVRKKPLPFPPEPLASIGIQMTRRALDSADHHEGRRNAWLKFLDRVGLGFDS